MATEKLHTVRFPPDHTNGYHKAVVADVKAYFKQNKISPYANGQMWVKTAVMLLLYFGPYAIMVTGMAGSSIAFYLFLWFLMGLGMVGIGTCVMHDANHGAYSSNKKINNFMGRILDLIGGYTVNWKIQHNLLHHTYTNIHILDEDIYSTVLLRFSPNQPRYWFHRFQHLYAWFLYSLMTLYWMTAADFLQAIRYQRYGLLEGQKVTLREAIWKISGYKLIYYAYIIVLPLLFSGMPWYFILSGFVIMHLTTGFSLALIFQLSHVVRVAKFASPVVIDGDSKMQDFWAKHQLENTTDFAPDNRFLTWCAGGLNFQVEHHLFPDICHVHYPRIASIVKSVTEAHGLPYNVEPTFWRALKEHVLMVKRLGTEPGPNDTSTLSFTD